MIKRGLLHLKTLTTGKTDHVKTRFVFIGAGGAAVKLLQMTGLPRSEAICWLPCRWRVLNYRQPKSHC